MPIVECSLLSSGISPVSSGTSASSLYATDCLYGDVDAGGGGGGVMNPTRGGCWIGGGGGGETKPPLNGFVGGAGGG